eukprot:evm.model.NODE_9070_length_7711_cov_25.106731.1
MGGRSGERQEVAIVLELVSDLLEDGPIWATVVVHPFAEETDFEGAFLSAVAFAQAGRQIPAVEEAAEEKEEEKEGGANDSRGKARLFKSRKGQFAFCCYCYSIFFSCCLLHVLIPAPYHFRV